MPQFTKRRPHVHKKKHSKSRSSSSSSHHHHRHHKKNKHVKGNLCVDGTTCLNNVHAKNVDADTIKSNTIECNEWIGVAKCNTNHINGNVQKEIKTREDPIPVPDVEFLGSVGMPQITVPGYFYTEPEDAVNPNAISDRTMCACPEELSAKPRETHQQNVLYMKNHVIKGQLCVEGQTTFCDTTINGTLIYNGSPIGGGTGPTGPAGPVGATGPVGPAGPAGPIGPTGSNGAQGPTGANGAQGPTGANGAQGPTGANGVQGPTGAVGAQGPTGANGDQGPTGAVGAQGPTGAVGAPGPTGANGAQGPIGPIGANGLAGETGPTGANGLVGATGPTGANGLVGATGPTGANTSCFNLNYLDNVGSKGDLVEIVYNGNTLAGVKKINCVPTFEWANKAGSATPSEGRGIAVDSNGNSYVTGYFTGTALFYQGDSTVLFTLTSYGGEDIFVGKLNTSGVWQWVVQAEGTSNDRGYSITVDCDGNSYVIGYFTGTGTFGTTTLTSLTTNVFVAKLDTNGNWLWAKQGPTYAINAPEESGFGIVVDCNGNSYVTGACNTPATFGTITLTGFGSVDIFIAKLDTNGNWIWARLAGGTNIERGFSINIDCGGNIYVTGLFRDTAIFGSTTLTSIFSDTEIFVTKLDINGNWQWTVQVRGTSDPAVDVLNRGWGIAVDCNGNSYVTGIFRETATFGSITLTSSGNVDLFVAKINTYGQWEWAVRVGNINSDRGYGIAVDCNGNCYVTGYVSYSGGSTTFGTITITSGTVSFVLDMFVAKIDTHGNWKWVKQITRGGSAPFPDSYSIGIDTNGNSYITGRITNRTTFGSFTLTTVGTTATIFVAKLHAFDLGVVGLLKQNATLNNPVSVCFPGGVILSDTFANPLIPAYHYYIDKDCQLSNCNKCAKRYLGIALDPTKLLTGVDNGCCGCCQ